MMDVSRETELALHGYTNLLKKWNPAINLISKATIAEIGTRHISDSRQLADISQESNKKWADLGSGGGLPGVVMAIMRPDLQVTLVESDARKCGFLRTVTRELKLKNIQIKNQRIEQLEPLGVPNISARALAPLPLLLAYVHRHLSPNGRAWLLKGRNWRTEVEEASIDWVFQHTVHQSRTDPASAILEITGIDHA